MMDAGLAADAVLGLRADVLDASFFPIFQTVHRRAEVPAATTKTSPSGANAAQGRCSAGFVISHNLFPVAASKPILFGPSHDARIEPSGCRPTTIRLSSRAWISTQSPPVVLCSKRPPARPSRRRSRPTRAYPVRAPGRLEHAVARSVRRRWPRSLRARPSSRSSRRRTAASARRRTRSDAAVVQRLLQSRPPASNNFPCLSKPPPQTSFHHHSSRGTRPSPDVHVQDLLWSAPTIIFLS